MILTKVHPAPAESFELDAPATRDRLLELYRPERETWLRLNLVTSVTGTAAGSDGTSETLTNATDRRILGVIRQLSDVVLVGAASVRAEGYQLPKRSRLAVVTASGDLSGHRLPTDDPGLVIVVCPASATKRVHETLGAAEIIIVPTEDGAREIGMPSLIAALRAAGHRSIVCEGGPTLAGQLVAANLVDELCLSTSPLLTEVTLPALVLEGERERKVTLQHLLLDFDSSLFARWSIAR